MDCGSRQRLGIDVRVLADAVNVRKESRRAENQHKFSNKIVALLRKQFGGHGIVKITFNILQNVRMSYMVLNRYSSKEIKLFKNWNLKKDSGFLNGLKFNFEKRVRLVTVHGW